MTTWRMQYGAMSLPEGGVQFRVWAPNVSALAVNVAGSVFPMSREGEDFHVLVPQARTGQTYSLVWDDSKQRPDPVSRSQPQGVHGPSEIIDPDAFQWTDQDWHGLDIEKYVIYELHTGTFTPEGKFEGVIAKIPYLKELGITAIELMPVAEFPGCRNWGYDGVDLFAPQSSYGGPEGLKKLVNAFHSAGLAVVLDVVYNHVGPEGNYLAEFGPYFTTQYGSPWGQAINFDGPGSDRVRQYFIDNALYWLTEYHMDALRLDAIHGIYDFSATHFLAELAERFHQQAALLGRQAWLIAESDLNDVRVIQPRSAGGYGMDAQWNDEFHHALTSYLTKAKRGFLGGFGRLTDVQKALTDGFVYDGIYSAYRWRRFGSSSKEFPGNKFVVFIQNHDQIANTNQGKRLSQLVSLDQFKVAATLLLCSPYVPLLFMGQEFADTAPFLYFTSYLDSSLAKLVTEGRRREHGEFEVSAEFFDPQARDTFEKSKITWPLLETASHAEILGFYRQVIALRKTWPCLSNCRKDLTRVEIDEGKGLLRMERGDPAGTRALLVCNFSVQAWPMDAPAAHWQIALQTNSSGRGMIAGHSAILYLAAEKRG
jgi:maltooligosyltrehalose trehalohydrolase